MKSNRLLAYLMIAPATVCIFLVCIYPVANGIFLSLTNFNMLRMKNVKFIGLENFIEILFKDREFWGVIGFTFIFVLGTILLSYLAGLILAVLLNGKIAGRMVFRAFFLFPWIVPSVVSSNSFLWILNDQTGIINVKLIELGIISQPVQFLADPGLARLTVIAVSAWKSFPFMMLVLLAGLQNISHTLYEAAAIDGAGKWKVFLHITVPHLKTVTVISTVLMSIWTFNNFDNVYLLTSGGPANATETISILSYYTAFFRNRLGYASAISVVMMVIMIFMNAAYRKSLKNS